MTIPQLTELRSALLALHKALLDAERANYEKTHGPIGSPGHFLQLLTSDPWFAWLRPISMHIVTIDEAMESKTPLTAETIDSLVDQVRQLVTPNAEGEGAAKRLTEVLQQSPRTAPPHEKVLRLLNPA